MRKRKIQTPTTSSSGIKQYAPNPNLPIQDALKIALGYMRTLGLVLDSTIDDYEGRIFGKGGNGIGLIILLSAGIETLGKLSITTIKLVNKNVNDIRDTPAARNNIKTAIRQVLEKIIELGLIEIPNEWLKPIKQEPNQPPEPETYSVEEIDLILQARVGNNPFEILRNFIIVALMLQRGLRPGQEIIGIKNSKVYTDQCCFDFKREYGGIHRCYIRRDLADMMAKYQLMRNQLIKKHSLQDTDVFFIHIN